MLESYNDDSMVLVWEPDLDGRRSESDALFTSY